jgi:hypothetical protein
MMHTKLKCKMMHTKCTVLKLHSKHLPEWLFHSRTGVGVRNSSGVGVGVGVGTGVGANNLFGVDLGVEFYCLNFALALASNT